jgi:hypothetical protein
MKINRVVTVLSFFLLTNACENAVNPTSEKVDPPVIQAATTESFVEIGQDKIDQWNKNIQLNNIITKSELENMICTQLMQSKNEEGNFTMEICTRQVNDSTTELTIKEMGIMDDSVKGIQTVFSIVNIEKRFVIKSMKENYQCYRGHQNWSAEKCN